MAPGELEPDDLEQVAGPVWPDGQDPGRVGCGVEIRDHERVLDGMHDVVIVHPVLSG